MGLKDHAKHGNFETIDWGVDIKGKPFKKCSEMKLDTEYKVLGIYISKDRGYGNGAVAILEDCLLNLPTSMLEEAKEILADPEAVEELKSGKSKLKISTFTSKKYNKIGYSVEFI